MNKAISKFHQVTDGQEARLFRSIDRASTILNLGTQKSKVMAANVTDNQLRAHNLSVVLMKALTDLRDAGAIHLTPNDMCHYVMVENFVTLVDEDLLSEETRSGVAAFMTSIGWNPNEPDPRKWGDFDRLYSYASNELYELFLQMSSLYNLAISAATKNGFAIAFKKRG